MVWEGILKLLCHSYLIPTKIIKQKPTTEHYENKSIELVKLMHLSPRLQADQTCYLEEYQPLTKLPINLWIDNGSRAYLSPLIYILGQGEIALKWNGEMIGVRHIR